jgi:membrane-bound lytic murein transglycosylase B
LYRYTTALYDALEGKQVSDAAADNLGALKTDASLAWSVVKSYSNSHVYDRADMYVSAIGTLGAVGL